MHLVLFAEISQSEEILNYHIIKKKITLHPRIKTRQAEIFRSAILAFALGEKLKKFYGVGPPHEKLPDSTSVVPSRGKLKR